MIQDVFVIPDGAPGALAELERRKFTAEEGVRVCHGRISCFLNALQDHLTLLNGVKSSTSHNECLLKHFFQPTMRSRAMVDLQRGANHTPSPSALCRELYQSEDNLKGICNASIYQQRAAKATQRDCENALSVDTGAMAPSGLQTAHTDPSGGIR